MLSHGYAIAFVEKRTADVSLGRVAEALVAPAGTPAVAHDEASLLGVAHQAHRVTAADGVRLKRIEHSVRRRGIVPGSVNIEPHHDRAVRREPGTPLREILVHVE